MRTPPIPPFQAAPDEPILCAVEARRIPAATPSEVLRLTGPKALRPRVEYYYRQLKALPRRLRRTLQRRYARSLAGVALLLALGQAPALAATINVGGGCTLVDAITAANTDLTTGGCPAGSGADVIALSGNVTLSAVNNTTDGPNGLPSVTSPLMINGGGHTLRRSTVTGTPEFRLLHLADTGNLTVNQLTLTNGRAGSPYDLGGAVLNRGALTLMNSTVSGNTAGLGGGLYSGSYVATATITNSTISGNTARSGGGVENGGTLTLTNSTVSGNTADDIYNTYGGGVENGGTLTLTHSSVSGNTADLGGGVSGRYGTATLTDSTVSGNSGGGLFNARGILTLTSSTVSGNNGVGLIHSLHDCDDGDAGNVVMLTNSTISGNIGGVTVVGDFDDCGIVTLAHTTVSGNRGGGVFNYASSRFYGGGRVQFVHSVISGNTAGPEVDNTSQYGGGTVSADDFNLFGVNGNPGLVGFTPGPTDIVPAAGVMLAEILAPLADNGGPTQTHGLVAGSPAIDASPLDQSCPLTDQRGVFRPQGQSCDIGAFEAGVEPDPFASPSPTSGCTVNGVPDQPCRGTAGPDRIIGTTRTDVILGLEGNDHLNGSRGDDRLFGGENNDRLIGSKGDDQLLGQTGDDDLRGLAGDDVLDGGDGNDRLKGHEGSDQLRGGNGDDALRGLEGQDTLEGGAGSDLLRGGGDADTLNGGPGADRLVGGGGTDRCASDAEDNIVVLCE